MGSGRGCKPAEAADKTARHKKPPLQRGQKAEGDGSVYSRRLAVAINRADQPMAGAVNATVVDSADA
ncbi:MAG: hypothetical protein OXH24_02525, partial [Cyanobacteria bacterium MAG IRC3_bin_20]|nr:hypothetical protein [Cyanobacteria bacterium MAG IRC3_bin_20]